MTAIDDILGKLPIDQLAAQLGSDPQSVRDASSQAIASLMGGLQRNASDPIGQRSLASALNDHRADQLLSEQRIDLGRIDSSDGEKIVRHALGADPATAAQAMAGRADTGLVQRLLPMIAPLVLAYLASRLGNRQIEQGRQEDRGGSILDGILGRGGQLGGNASEEYQRGYRDGYQAARQENQQQGGMNLGDLIGGMLGQQPQRQQGGLGGLLGGLFG